jgi:hypothetical protein
MEEQKFAKKGITYPSKVGELDYVEYQSRWVMKKKLKKMDNSSIEKMRNKYLKYIELYDAELKSRENEETKKKQEEEDKEKELLDQLMKKYNKV